MELTVLDRIRTNPDTVKVVTGLLIDLAKTSLDEPGCLGFVASETNIGEFHVHQRYTNQQALATHRSSPHYREFRERLSNLTAEVETLEGQTLQSPRERLGQAVVLGGSGGIGKACALVLAEVGYEVVIADIETASAESVAHEFVEMGLTARSAAVDVSDPHQLAALFGDVARQNNPLEILVNSAGHIDLVEFGSVTDEQIERMISVHLQGTMIAAKKASDIMRQTSYGRIVNISSVAALKGSPNHSHYAAAKAGIVGFTKSVSQDLAGTGITVNCVLPGPIRTPMLDGLSDESLEALAATPVGRIGIPDDVAHAVAFLCSPNASFITGATLLVAGGSYV